MIEILMLASWIGFTAYSIWYFTLAKHYFPISINEAKMLWKIHKQHIGCDAKKWRVIKRGDNVVGFECGCGYKHLQRRPIVSGAPALNVDARGTQISAFDKLHTSYKSK